MEKTVAELQNDLHESILYSNDIIKTIRRRSSEFIRVNNITKNDIQLSSGVGVPYYFTLPQFGEWLKSTNCDKLFCEWNNKLHYTSRVIHGNYEPTDAYLEDVE